ncbi:MAG TPA: hypothetical protein VMF69_14935 [Gemmataceae bacterium]|nr:hypothetical protein [Gemmataceae bacterium]
MGPVRIKYWGLMWITRPTYVVLQSLAIGLCAVCLAIGFLAVLLAGTVVPQGADLFLDIGLLLFWIGFLAFPLECIEMYIMLRKFARAEAEQQAMLAALDASGPAPSAPSSTDVQLPPNTNIQP